MLVRELAAKNMLRQAFFLWDDLETSSVEGLEVHAEKQAQFYGIQRSPVARDLLRQAVRHPRDIWLCTHINYSSLGYLFSRFSRRRFGIMLHAAELDEAFTWVKRFVLRRAGHLFAVSEFTKKKAVRLGVRSDRVKVLYNGVDDPCPNFAPNDVRTDKQTVLFVGRMDERYKGQMELLDAMVLLRRRLPDLRLVFVGGGRTLDEWKSEAHMRNLSAVVEFRGHTSDAELYHAYEEAMLFAMPSHNEGFGLVYAEAMAHGVPCIGSDRDAASEVISHGQTGYCVPAGNATALADALLTMVKSPALRDQFGRASRERFTANFTGDQYRERLIAAMAEWRDSLG